MSVPLSVPVTLPLFAVVVGGAVLICIGGLLFRSHPGMAGLHGAPPSRYGGHGYGEHVPRFGCFGCSPWLVLVLLALAVGLVLLWPTMTKGEQFPRISQVLADVQQPSTSDSVIGGPSLSATTVDHILSAAGSPAEGEPGMGAYVSQLSQQYHIDDAFALAFFHHESSYGKAGVARETKSWGNIRCTPGWPRCDPSGGYRAYPSWHAGALDWFQNISSVYVQHGVTTLDKILPHYAPPTDGNNDTAYQTAVLVDVARWHKGVETP
jgi:hypothetical protein